jgi:hypothetical protein
MLLKICHRPNGFLIINNVKAALFTAFHEAQAIYNDTTKDLEDSTGKVTCLVSPEFLAKEQGCTKQGSDDHHWWLNQVTVLCEDNTSCEYAFTGTAYLCTDEGKTVDVMRG